MRTPALLVQRGWAALAALAASLLVVAAPAYANDDEAVDPPARVGRISALRGQVDRSSGLGAAWEAARINQPVTGQTALWAPPGSQAEVRIGSGSVRLDSNTQAVFSQLDDHGIALDVAQGTVRARVRNLPSGDHFSISADGVRADAQGPGDYRVSYDPDRRIYTVGAIAGRLRIVSPNSSLLLEAGQQGIIERGGDSLRIDRLGALDDFDAWAEARDRDQDRLASTRYVSPETTGIEALDEYGRWEVADDYGAVWYPRAVPSGWAPYRYGHWAWVSPWGWTWVDDAPWGFAPFHYGRWALLGSNWGWVPGPIVARPYYAPALVGYVGGRGGSGVSVSIGIGIGAPIGWFPLAPYEYYHPPYRSSTGYASQVNIINVTNINNVTNVTNVQRPAGNGRAGRLPMPDAAVYRYAQRPEAVTVVSEDSFRHARPIGRDRLPLTAQQAAQLQPVAAALPGPRERPGVASSIAPRPATVPAGMPLAVLPAPAPSAFVRGSDAPQRPRAHIPGPRNERAGIDDDRRVRALPGVREANEGRVVNERLRPWPSNVNPAAGTRAVESPAQPAPAARNEAPRAAPGVAPMPATEVAPALPRDGRAAQPARPDAAERLPQRPRDERQSDRGRSSREERDERVSAPRPAPFDRAAAPVQAPAAAMPAPRVAPSPPAMPRELPPPQQARPSPVMPRALLPPQAMPEPRMNAPSPAVVMPAPQMAPRPQPQAAPVVREPQQQQQAREAGNDPGARGDGQAQHGGGRIRFER